MNKVVMGIITILVLMASVLLLFGAMSSFLNSKEGYVFLFLIIVALAYFIVSMLGEKVSRETNYIFAFLVLYAILVLVGIIPPFRTRTGGATTPTVMIGFIIISAIIAGYLAMKKRKKEDQET